MDVLTDTDSKYRELIEQRKKLKLQIKQLSEADDDIKEEVAELMHLEKINEKKVLLEDGEEWTCKYKQTARPKTNYTLLQTMLTSEQYDEVVDTTPVEYLDIRKSPKKKATPNRKSAQRPVDDGVDTKGGGKPVAPTGTFGDGIKSLA